MQCFLTIFDRRRWSWMSSNASKCHGHTRQICVFISLGRGLTLLSLFQKGNELKFHELERKARVAELVPQKETNSEIKTFRHQYPDRYIMRTTHPSHLHV